VFEPLAWTAIAYLLTRAALLDDRRALVWSGVVGGLAFGAKYALVMWLIALLVGLIVTPERRLLARRELWLGIGVMIAIAVPSVIWQAVNGWPFVALVHAAADKNANPGVVAFIANQVLVQNPLLAPLWIAGLVVPFVWRDLARLRFVAIAYVVVTALTIVSHGKDYYIMSAYPPLYAIGGIALERVVRSGAVRVAYLGLAFALSAIIAPVAMPILPPADVPGYMQRVHLQPQKQEKDFAGTALPQGFADELGWHDFVREVGNAYRSIPAAEREHTAILVDNYGEAAALDIYGDAYGLPPALSGHNQYFLWGLRGQHPENVLRVQRRVERLRSYCADVHVLGTTESPFAMSFENGKSIAFCRGLKTPLATLWPLLENFS
jgi:Dolichyl-phosphate-mannose-protein mannosyltransferase